MWNIPHAMFSFSLTPSLLHTRLARARITLRAHACHSLSPSPLPTFTFSAAPQAAKERCLCLFQIKLFIIYSSTIIRTTAWKIVAKLQITHGLKRDQFFIVYHSANRLARRPCIVPDNAWRCYFSNLNKKYVYYILYVTHIIRNTIYALCKIAEHVFEFPLSGLSLILLRSGPIWFI